MLNENEVVSMENYQISAFLSSHIDDAVKLVELHYEDELKQIQILPAFTNYVDNIKKSLNYLSVHGVGISILSNQKLIAFMVGYPVDELFGKEKGIFVPAFGHGSLLKDSELEILLYEKSAQKWVEQKIFTHAISIFAHDDMLLNLYFDLGFGKRCADAIKKVDYQQKIIHPYQFIEIKSDLSHLLVDIHKEHHLYYRSSPIFMPNQDEDALKDLNEWLSISDHHMFALLKNLDVIGYIRYQNHGESIFSIHQTMKNITGLYVLPKYRNQGIGKILLAELESSIENNDIKRLGVDFETINPKAYRFWSKHFNVYAYSLVRRIDERIMD